ncbi:MAG: NUDIX hydrolase [Solirubrobacteraceae bacterium]
MSSESSSLTDALRAALREPREGHARHVHGRIQAAVLVPLYVQDGALHAVFTRRHDELRRHPGEISFPGGRRDDHEDDLATTALREAEEEIGLPRGAVELLGPLTPTPTVATSYAIYPFAGLIEPGRTWNRSVREVDQVLELRLDDLRASLQRRLLTRRGIPFRTSVYVIDDERYIWGATARIVTDLLHRVAPLLPGG